MLGRLAPRSRESRAMGQDLTIWRSRRGWPLRSVPRVLDRLGQDRAPFALARFDAQAFAQELRGSFGDGDDAVFNIEVCDFKGQRANWINLSCGWGTPPKALDDLVAL